ncbi:MAG TPA: YhdT family protein [Bacillota bacterium]|nr:YhdT family protein [Bacillota bacterium]
MQKQKGDRMDKRFKIANREAWFGVALVIFNFVWWFAFAYGLGRKDPADYSYVFGLPAWFFYSCVVGYIVMVVLVTMVVKLFFTDLPLDGEEGDEK